MIKSKIKFQFGGLFAQGLGNGESYSTNNTGHRATSYDTLQYIPDAPRQDPTNVLLAAYMSKYAKPKAIDKPKDNPFEKITDNLALHAGDKKDFLEDFEAMQNQYNMGVAKAAASGDQAAIDKYVALAQSQKNALMSKYTRQFEDYSRHREQTGKMNLDTSLTTSSALDTGGNALYEVTLEGDDGKTHKSVLDSQQYGAIRAMGGSYKDKNGVTRKLVGDRRVLSTQEMYVLRDDNRAKTNMLQDRHKRLDLSTISPKTAEENINAAMVNLGTTLKETARMDGKVIDFSLGKSEVNHAMRYVFNSKEENNAMQRNALLNMFAGNDQTYEIVDGKGEKKQVTMKGYAPSPDITQYVHRLVADNIMKTGKFDGYVDTARKDYIEMKAKKDGVKPEEVKITDEDASLITKRANAVAFAETLAAYLEPQFKGAFVTDKHNESIQVTPINNTSVSVNNSNSSGSEKDDDKDLLGDLTSSALGVNGVSTISSQGGFTPFNAINGTIGSQYQYQTDDEQTKRLTDSRSARVFNFNNTTTDYEANSDAYDPVLGGKVDQQKRIDMFSQAVPDKAVKGYTVMMPVDEAGRPNVGRYRNKKFKTFSPDGKPGAEVVGWQNVVKALEKTYDNTAPGWRNNPDESMSFTRTLQIIAKENKMKASPVLAYTILTTVKAQQAQHLDPNANSADYNRWAETMKSGSAEGKLVTPKDLYRVAVYSPYPTNEDGSINWNTVLRGDSKGKVKLDQLERFAKTGRRFQEGGLITSNDLFVEPPKFTLTTLKLEDLL
jgi:hypothetical protein